MKRIIYIVLSCTVLALSGCQSPTKAEEEIDLDRMAQTEAEAESIR
ncbi:MAG: hypothetical protein KDK50_05685 [Chlamydiia bacterium]|nr:hypothetical protein [Chlamydiia bacterium]